MALGDKAGLETEQELDRDVRDWIGLLEKMRDETEIEVVILGRVVAIIRFKRKEQP